MTMNYKPLIYSLYDIGAVKFGDFTLKSGQQSKLYMDLRLIVSYPDVLRAVSEAIWQQVNAFEFDRICGVPYTALPIATCISLQQNIPMVMRRKEPKAHGTRQQIEGTFDIGQSCLIVEDIITTGSSIIETANDLEIVGLKIRDVAVLINREEGGKENLHQQHYRLNAAFTLKEMLQTLLSYDQLSSTDLDIINSFLHETV
jgi:uridine monophosphate synthetase